MARRPRSDPRGAWHHVMNRGARHQPTFGDDIDRMTFVSLLAVVHERFDVETQVYCLMDNHYHLVLHCPSGGLSEALHYLGTVYTQRFNRKYGLDGALFRGRFHSIPVTSDEYLLQASRYIHRNPTDLHTTGELWEYPWSSYGVYLGHRRRPKWLGQPMALTLMNNDLGAYQKFVQAPDPPGSVEPEPAETLLSKFARADDGDGQRLRRTPHEDSPGLDEIEVIVASVSGTGIDQLLVSRRGQRNVPRLIAVYLAIETTDIPADELADRYQVSGRDAIWSMVRRARGLLRADASFKALVCDVQALIHRPDLHDIA